MGRWWWACLAQRLPGGSVVASRARIPEEGRRMATPKKEGNSQWSQSRGGDRPVKSAESGEGGLLQGCVVRQARHHGSPRGQTPRKSGVQQDIHQVS